MLTNHYLTIVAIHSLWRWLVLLGALAAIAVSIAGLLYKLPFKPMGRRAGVFYVVCIDVQLLIGITLYCISPIVRTALADMGAAMKQHELRFFSVEHTVFMLLAVALAHIGAVRSKRAVNDRAAYMRSLIWYAASLIAILGGIPWWRPLLRI